MKKTYFHLIVAFALFAILLISYFFWYRAFSAERSRVALLTSEVAGQNATEARASEANAALLQLAADEKEIHSYFVDSNDVVSFLEDLQAIGGNLGAKVSVLSVKDAAAPRPHLDLALTISGSFNAVVSAAGAIEYAPYDITVNSLTISAVGDATEGEGPWTASMALSVGATASSTTATTTP